MIQERRRRMVAHPKPKRTERRGLRPTLKFPPEIDPKDIERMGQVVQGVLRDSHDPTDEDQAILMQAYFLALRRKVLQRGDQKKADEFLGELNDNEKILHQLGFKEYRDIRPLNFWVLEGERTNQLEDLIRQIEEKCPKIKK